MRMTLECPFCEVPAEYKEDKKFEALGMYSFRCDDCEIEFSVSKKSTKIKYYDED